MENVYATMVLRIVAEQAKVIGPIAYAQANQVPGLAVDGKTHAVMISGDGPKVVDALIEQYKNLFGNLALEVCKEAVGKLRFSVNTNQLPQLLK